MGGVDDLAHRGDGADGVGDMGHRDDLRLWPEHLEICIEHKFAMLINRHGLDNRAGLFRDQLPGDDI